VVGTDEDGVEITTAHGRFGAYLKRGTDTRSLENEDDLFTLDVAEALKLLAQPKKGRRQRASEPLKVLGKSPEDEDIKLMEGRFGPYVTDGTTNASVPKGTDPQSVTLDQALHLIAERRARGPAKGGRKKKTATGKKTARKKTAKKTGKKRAASK
jgi:DNA topoisomerase-1